MTGLETGLESKNWFAIKSTLVFFLSHLLFFWYTAMSDETFQLYESLV